MAVSLLWTRDTPSLCKCLPVFELSLFKTIFFAFIPPTLCIMKLFCVHQEVFVFPIITKFGLWKDLSRIRNPKWSASRVSYLRWPQCISFFVASPWRLCTGLLEGPKRINQTGRLVSERNGWEKRGKIHKWNEFGTCDTVFSFYPNYRHIDE